MLFTRVDSMLAVLTFGLVALANAGEKRQATSSVAIVTTLEEKVNGLTSQLRKIFIGNHSQIIFSYLSRER